MQKGSHGELLQGTVSSVMQLQGGRNLAVGMILDFDIVKLMSRLVGTRIRLI
jgi:hypothetical protein